MNDWNRLWIERYYLTTFLCCVWKSISNLLYSKLRQLRNKCFLSWCEIYKKDKICLLGNHYFVFCGNGWYCKLLNYVFYFYIPKRSLLSFNSATNICYTMNSLVIRLTAILKKMSEVRVEEDQLQAWLMILKDSVCSTVSLVMEV